MDGTVTETQSVLLDQLISIVNTCRAQLVTVNQGLERYVLITLLQAELTHSHISLVNRQVAHSLCSACFMALGTTT